MYLTQSVLFCFSQCVSLSQHCSLSINVSHSALFCFNQCISLSQHCSLSISVSHSVLFCISQCISLSQCCSVSINVSHSVSIVLFLSVYLTQSALFCFYECISLTQHCSVRVCWLVGCLTSQQHASVYQGRICSDNFTCCHTEIEVADPTYRLTQSQFTDTGLISFSTDPIMPGAWQGSHWSANT